MEQKGEIGEHSRSEHWNQAILTVASRGQCQPTLDSFTQRRLILLTVCYGDVLRS